MLTCSFIKVNQRKADKEKENEAGALSSCQFEMARRRAGSVFDVLTDATLAVVFIGAAT